MVLRPEGDGAVVAIGQASHAWLSGQLARAWGNERFPAPAPREEVCLGAEQHDVGMAEWDLAPELNAATGLPTQFFEVERRTHLRLWADAPRRMLTQSRYAALLVSLHGTGLYERFPPRTDDPEIARAIAEYHEGQRELQEALAAEVGAGWVGLRRNQALLAAWDDLSLALCQASVPREVPDVPAAGDERVSVTLAAAGDTYTLDPWPLTADAVEVQVEGRRLDGPFAAEAALHAALAQAPVVTLQFALRRPG
jgi:Protein of unknown function (DUF3891)